VDSKSEADMPAILIGEPIIACLNNPQCNTPSEDEDEWVTNDNISFDYLASVGLFESIMDSSLHMPLHKPSASSTPMESIEGAVLVIPPFKEGQSPIIFGKAQPRGSAAADSSSDSDTPQFFHYARPARHIMKKMGYNLKHGEGLNFKKGRRSLLRNFVPKGKPVNYYDNTRRGLRYVTPTSPSTVQLKDDEPIPSHSASSSEWASDVSMRMMFENLTVNMTSSSQLEPVEATDEELWAQQLDLQWESDSNYVTHLLKTR